MVLDGNLCPYVPVWNKTHANPCLTMAFVAVPVGKSSFEVSVLLFLIFVVISRRPNVSRGGNDDNTSQKDSYNNNNKSGACIHKFLDSV